MGCGGICACAIPFAWISLRQPNTSYMNRPGTSSPSEFANTSDAVPLFSQLICIAVAAPPPNIHNWPPWLTQVPIGFVRPGYVSQRSSDIGSTVMLGSFTLRADLLSVYQITCL